MKFTSNVSAGLIGMSLLVAASAQDPVKFNVPGVGAGAPQTAAPAAAVPAKPAAPKFTEAQILEAYGWYTGMRMGLAQLEFTKEQVEAMSRGMVRAAAGEQPPSDATQIGPEIEAFLGKKNDVFMTKVRMESLAQGAAFFTKLKENKNVVELPSGLRYEVLKAGTGAVPKVGQMVNINYIGTLTSGQEFDNSIKRGQPIDMVLQTDHLIPGMIEGLQKIAVGGKIKLYIPPSLAYGDEGSQGIPPGATLVFEVDLLSVKDAPKDAPAAAPAGK